MGKEKRELPATKTRILIVDDHPLVRERLTDIINLESDLLVCGEAESRAQALAVAAKTQPDLAIVDLTLKDSLGLELIKDLRIRHPKLVVLVVSMHAEDVYAERALHAGAAGYITKDEASRRILQAIRTVMRGEMCFSVALTQKLLTRLAANQPAPGLEMLSDRELDVLRLIGQGFNAAEIAARLHLAPSTVETYRTRIRQKLQLGEAGELLRYAISWVRATNVPPP